MFVFLPVSLCLIRLNQIQCALLQYTGEAMRGQGWDIWSGAEIERQGVTQQRQKTLKQMRLQRALSMSELARAAGVSASTIMDIEAGAQPRMRTIRKLAAALGCEPQDIAWPGDPFGELDLG